MKKNYCKVQTEKNILLTIFALFLLVALLLGGCAGQSEQKNELSSLSNARLVAQGNGVCLDTRSGKMWQVGRSKTIKSLDAATKYTAALQDGGFVDWRLPSVTELYELYMIFDLHENGNCELDAEGTYWSDEADLEGRVGTWELDDNCDPERRYIPKQTGKVRAIRS